MLSECGDARPSFSYNRQPTSERSERPTTSAPYNQISHMPHVTHLECSACAKRHTAGDLHNVCECGGPLLVRYDLDAIRKDWPRDAVSRGPASMWRYAPILPVSDASHVVSLGEGMTPPVHARRLGKTLGSGKVCVYAQGLQPHGAFRRP